MKFRLLFFGLAITLWSCANSGVKKSGVTGNGYKYTIHTSSTKAKPQEGEYVYFHAQTRNGDKVVMTSREQGNGIMPVLQYSATPPPGQESSPLLEVMPLLSIGDSVTIDIRLDTIPAAQRPPGFQDVDVMFYDLVVMDIKSKEAYEEEKNAKQAEATAARTKMQGKEGEIKTLVEETLAKYKSGALDGDIVTTASGLKVYFHEKTEGKLPSAGSNLITHYYGALMSDASEFDNSFKRGQALPFPLGQGRVIKGWDEGFALLPEGSKATLFIPYDLAYGEAGSPPAIPAKADLMFYVELEKIQ